MSFHGFIVCELLSDIYILSKCAWDLVEINFSEVLKMFFLAGRMGQVIECLSSKCEALSSNPSIAKKSFGYISILFMLLLFILFYVYMLETQ
jgi:hypothetical protein